MSTCRLFAWSPPLARLALAVLVLLIGYGLFLAVPSVEDLPEFGEHPMEQGDLSLYREVVARMAAGESFYVAKANEQHARGYPTTPFLTWRLPTLAWLIVRLGESGAVHLLHLLGLLTMVSWGLTFRELGLAKWGVAVGLLMVYASLVVIIPPKTVYLHEAWAATLIALSLPLWQRFWPLSLVCGVTALAMRELALPYVVVMALLAHQEGKQREAIWWGIGTLGFCLGLSLHALQVGAHLPVQPLTGGGWLVLGGWAFLLKVNQLNLLVLTAGSWLAAFVVPMAMVGATVVRGPVGRRLMVILLVYDVLFLFVGRPNNLYWGIIYGPLVTASLTFAPQAIWQIWCRAWTRQHWC